VDIPLSRYGICAAWRCAGRESSVGATDLWRRLYEFDASESALGRLGDQLGAGTDAELGELGRRGPWLTDVLSGDRPVGLPWESLAAFVRITTHPQRDTNSLTPDQAWGLVAEWLGAGPAWIPVPTDRHAALLGDLVTRYQLRGKLVPDAHLAALAIEHDLTLCSADTDFARFAELRWENPLAPSR
jgi:toxin-antitoxin system PIN domain toxin